MNCGEQRVFYGIQVPKSFPVHRCFIVAPPASLLSPLKAPFKNCDILQDDMPRLISGSQLGGQRREEMRRHKIVKQVESPGLMSTLIMFV